MRSLRAFSVGGSAPNPPGFTAFFRQNGLFLLCFKGTGSTCPPAFPAAESVARVASQHCPIPSGSGRLIINRAARALNEKAANGKYPLNFVSHIWAHRRSSIIPSRPSSPTASSLPSSPPPSYKSPPVTPRTLTRPPTECLQSKRACQGRRAPDASPPGPKPVWMLHVLC